MSVTCVWILADTTKPDFMKCPSSEPGLVDLRVTVLEDWFLQCTIGQLSSGGLLEVHLDNDSYQSYVFLNTVN